MSCILTGLSAIKLNPARLSLTDVIWSVSRDLAVLSWHTLLLYWAFKMVESSDFYQVSCIKQSSIIPWLIFDNLVTLLRLVKNPLQYIANKQLYANGSNWTNPVDFSDSWIRYFSPRFLLCQMRLYTVADWLTYFSWILGAWAVHPPSDVCEANFVVQAGYFEISFSTFVYVFCIAVYVISFSIYRTSKGRCLPGYEIKNDDWPASCPSIYFDRTQWRQPGESLVDYRQRVVDDFNSRNIVRTQPNDIELMRTDDCRLTQTELDTLKILTFTCHEVRRKPSVRSIVSLQQKPKITRPKSIRNSSIDSKRRISSEAFGKTANESSSYGYQTVMTEAESVVVVKLNEANAEEGHGERTTDEVCALCLEDYEEGDVLRELHCNHRYHAECVDSWLIGNKRTCPVCNADACGRVAVPVDSASDAQPSAEV